MAKGNDGNLLQHAVECEIIRELSAGNAGGQFHLVSTHGMAPFEPLTDNGRPFTKLLRAWLDVATGRPLQSRFEDGGNLPAVVAAYRRCLTTFLHYPNTSELAAALVGRSSLTGFVCERHDDTFRDLEKHWAGTGLRVLHGDWRDQIDTIAPSVPGGPWLVTMDPNTFEAGSRSIPANFCSGDFELVRELVGARLRSQWPGCFCLFCYSMAAPTETLFRAASATFATGLGRDATFVRVQAQHGRDHATRFHVGLFLSNRPDLLGRVEAVWNRMKSGPSEWTVSTGEEEADPLPT